MLKVGRHLDFLHEPLAAEDGGELGLEHLDGDPAPVPDVAGKVDGGHGALADLSLDLVSSGKHCRQPIRDPGHRGLSYGEVEGRASILMVGAVWCSGTSRRLLVREL